MKPSIHGNSLGIVEQCTPNGGRIDCLPEGARDLTLAARRRILLDSSEYLRKRFVERGAERVAKTKIRIDEQVRDKPRHFAGCRTDGLEIVLSGDLALQPPAVVSAIIAHEFGHATDFCYPGSFLLQPGGRLLVRAQGIRTNQALPRALLDYWENRDADTVERTADRIAERILGVRIGYCGPCLLQTMLVGAPQERNCKYPRPRGLK